MGAELGVVSETEVGLEDGGEALGQARISRKEFAVQDVFAAAPVSLEALALRGVAEVVGLFQGGEAYDGDLLHHCSGLGAVAADDDEAVGLYVGYSELRDYPAAVAGEGDAKEVVLESLANELGDGFIGRSDAADLVFGGYHRLRSFSGTVCSMSLRISSQTSSRSQVAVSGVSSSRQEQYSSLS